jgi:hypothetical protein
MTTEMNRLPIQTRIFTLRGQHVILDRDIAELYGVATKVLNQAVKRNASRFPSDFAFHISKEEVKELVTSCDRLKSLKHSSAPPVVFTELGVTMIASVLNSTEAVRISIEIVRVFVALKNHFKNGDVLLSRMSNIEQVLLEHATSIKTLSSLYEDIHQTKHGIFFNDQIFDAYVFVCELIQRASTSIILIDNYVDETTLLQLSKRKDGVKATIYTEKISTQLQLDLSKHQAQYAAIDVKIKKHIHDRFLIIDNKELYHIGASLKDLGKKWFAFSRIDSILQEIANKI